MGMIVRYNGGTLSWRRCSDPSNLIVGKEYEVISEDDQGIQSNYTLKGVDGYFNSCWFDKVDSKKTFIAFSNKVPTVGERYKCNRLEFICGNPKLVSCVTSTVKAVLDIGNNIYRVSTANSVYIVQVK